MKLKHFLCLLVLSALSMMIVGLYNGYPIMDSDTGAYIRIGFENTIAPDRTPFYGWFIRYTSFWTSLWLTLFIQCLLLSYLLLRYINFIQKKEGGARTSLLTVVAIVSFTCVSWVASFLMPDIFAGMLLLSVLLYLSADGTRRSAVINLAILFFTLLIHNSHVLILSIFSLTMLGWSVVKKHKIVFKRALMLLALCAGSWLMLCTINSCNGNGFTFSKGGHVFIMARLVEMGIVQMYLNDNCGKKDFHLCAYKDHITEYSWDFIWSGASPLYKTGGWDSSKAGYDSIIHGILFTPKYLQMLVRKSAVGTLRELSDITVPATVRPVGKDTPPWSMVGKYFEDELHEYEGTSQNAGILEGNVYNYVYLLMFILSSLWVLFYSKNMSREILFIYGIIILFVVVNAFVMSTFSTILNRYQNRVFWILPATNLIVIIKYYKDRAAARGEES